MRLGVVSYLNALPLVDGLAVHHDLESGTPAAIADRLLAGSLDVGLVPVFEAARARLYAVPGIGIAARGEVRSVLLASRVPLARVGRVALDPASRTSAALTRLLLDRDGLRPTLVAGPDDGDPIPPGADAGLVIGDRALRLEGAGLEVIDLGAWWRARTGLPFVFAVWAGPDPDRVASVAGALLAAKSRGVADLVALAAREGPRRGIPAAVAEHYLRTAIAYDVGADERRGLAEFVRLLRLQEMLPDGAEVRFTG